MRPCGQQALESALLIGLRGRAYPVGPLNLQGLPCTNFRGRSRPSSLMVAACTVMQCGAAAVC